MAEPFELLETIRWTPDGGFFLLDRHLRRMNQSAAHFNYQCSTSRRRDHLERAVAGASGAQRVRLLLATRGDIRVECTPLESDAATRTARLGIAASPIDPRDPFLFHKTTNREVYRHARRPDCDDVVLWNPDRQVTESTIANIVVDIGGRRVTPPVQCGLLAGTFRAELLESGAIQESIVTLDELQSASRLWLINSVREWWPATLHRDR
jgi:branched-subunit amino acid aminotransferase/4-amino-4-deoxychorismate lyase